MISYSQISLYQECPQKWAWAYIEKVPAEPNKAFQFGGKVHALIAENIEKGTYQNFEASKSFPLEDNPERAKHLAIQLAKQAPIALSQLGITKTLHVELRIELNNWVGIIDYVGETSKGELVILDWKTTSSTYNEHDILTSDQLTSYAWLYLKKYNRLADKVGYVTLNKNTTSYQTFFIKPDKDDLDKFDKKRQNIGRLINKKIVWQDPKSCYDKWGRCGYYDLCWKKKKIEIAGQELPTLLNRF